METLLPDGSSFFVRKKILGCDSLLFQAESPVNALDQHQDDRLPADKPPEPVQKLAVHHMWLLPRVGEHPLQVHFLVAVRARLLLPDDAPASDAKFVESGTKNERIKDCLEGRK